MSRPVKVIVKEVEAAMKKHDIDNSGTLDFLEFLEVWKCGAEFFRFEALNVNPNPLIATLHLTLTMNDL